MGHRQGGGAEEAADRVGQLVGPLLLPLLGGRVGLLHGGGQLLPRRVHLAVLDQGVVALELLAADVAVEALPTVLCLAVPQAVPVGVGAAADVVVVVVVVGGAVARGDSRHWAAEL